MRWTVPLLFWGIATVGLVLFAGFTKFRIGRIVMPGEQRVVMALVLSLVFSFIGLWVWMGVRVAARFFGYEGPQAFVELPLVRNTLIVLLLLAIPLFLYGRFIEPRWLAVRTVPLGIKQGTPIRIAVISDLHIDEARAPFTEVADAINRNKPDVVVLLGDLLNRESGLPVLHQVLKDIEAEHKLAVYGNWETWYWKHLPLLEGTGFTWLHSGAQTVVRTSTVHLVGLPYSDTDRGDEAEAILGDLPDEDWRVFLYHTPDLAEQVPSADLYLAGHTHGGQVAVPLFGAFLTLSRYGKRFERGLVRIKDRYLYTNPGVGVEPATPLRIGVRPEVTIIELYGK